MSGCREAPGAHAQYHLHLLNDGRFPATVRLGLASQGGVQAATSLATPLATPATGKPSAATAAAAKPGQAAAKGQAAPPAPPPAFQLSSQVAFKYLMHQAGTLARLSNCTTSQMLFSEWLFCQQLGVAPFILCSFMPRHVACVHDASDGSGCS